MGPLEIMRLHLETLFTHDSAGDITRVNEPTEAIAPRFFLGRTVEGSVCRFRYDLAEDVRRELEALRASEPFGDELLLPPHGSADYAVVLARGAPVLKVWTGPAYMFPSERPSSRGVVIVTGENADVLRPYFPGWLGDVDRLLMLALIEGGRAVSLCASVRTTERAHQAGVETHRELRGRGFAARVVSAWAAAVRRIGCLPLYSASWQNTASQAVASRLGLIRFGTDLHIT